MGTVTFTNNETGEKFEFEILNPTRGPQLVDFSKFYETTGMFTFDPGYGSTANCKSEISFVDGKKGELVYYGHPIEELVEKYKFVDVIKLLIGNGYIFPTKEESDQFERELVRRSYIHEGLRKIIDAFPDGAHPMANLSSSVSALSTFYYDHIDMEYEAEYQTMARRIIAKTPTLAAFAYRSSVGSPFVYPDADRGYVENFLYMLRAYPHGKLKEEISPIEVSALDTIFMLHADHGQNASTATVRNVASTGVHPYAALSAGLSALWGKAHGGANESVMDQLEMIGDVKNVDRYIAKAKDKNDSFRLMGFGHRVYKSYDPRARILRKLKDDLDQKGVKMNQRLVEIAEKIEEVATQDEYFLSRSLYPNVDFYSGIILTALKIPKSMFTPIFAIGRMPGWCGQVLELLQEPNVKITRPRQMYVGK
ncbi:citrate synthase [Wolinella succinogenes]|uniref:Citrate synthase n=1 Tax=Wolinella succinogenes (strain ATCC 29543 / DSM 1740 / CCUG 13145 / JCM 31913 / LMG 7466 / NCTC 11488 / FDC 602W) TaxID=273121 RepID=Q7M8S3_WOLSU|nr:citrate synthase [Wolinella succinogenes]CAE10512.1 CITRATE SYNTHASE [Wolinella succinogenes]VEG80655.1 Citrate synthase [Wolinella succinogenes]HCZ18811.1 citrate synthase [Helicobacter sp.]